MMMMMIMRCNIYTVSRVSVSKHYVEHGSFSHAFGIYGYRTLMQWVRHLRFAVYWVTAARGSFVFWEPCVLWSLTSQPIIVWLREQFAFYRFASSRFAKYPHPVWVFSEVFWMDGSKQNVSTSCSRSLSRIYSNPNTKVIFHCIIILYVTSLLINQQWGKAYFRVEHMLPSL